MTAALDELVAAYQRGDFDGVASAGKRMLAVPIDMEAFVNVVRVPDDAGDLASGLETILRRIPGGWGRWIRVERGWYPIIIGLDEKLADLDPDYRVLQVKEKFGGLRYYWRQGEATHRRGVVERGNDLVNAAVALAARTCDACGQVGTLVERRGWLRTLCMDCAGSMGYADTAL